MFIKKIKETWCNTFHMSITILIKILDKVIEKEIFFTRGDMIKILTKLEDLFLSDGFTLNYNNIIKFFRRGF
jgi:hypothetical protein